MENKKEFLTVKMFFARWLMSMGQLAEGVVGTITLGIYRPYLGATDFYLEIMMSEFEKKHPELMK